MRAPAWSAAPAPSWPWSLVVVGCVLLAVLSLLLARQTTYDPTAWLIWGREIVEGDLSTTAGPSWKPLPVLATTPLALLGDAAQQQLWLVIARAGGLLAIVLAYRLGARLAGPAAGVLAAVALVLSREFVSFALRGNSEGLLVALALGSIEAHLARRRGLALGLAIATTLLRPEVWPLVAGYALWLVWGARPRERPWRRTAALAAAAVAVVALWFVPEQVGSGQLLRAASRALQPVEGSPAEADLPFVATFTNAAGVLPWPLYIGAVALVAAAAAEAARTRRASLPLVLAAIATLLMVLVAAMAQAGFTGNSRYLVVPVALTGVLGGAGLVWLGRLLAAAPGRVAAAAGTVGAVLVAITAVGTASRLGRELRDAVAESRAYAGLPEAIASAGGRAAVLRCGVPYTGPFFTQGLARELHVHQREVGIHPRPPGTIFTRRADDEPPDRRFAVVASTERWVVRAACSRAGDDPGAG